MKTDRLLLRRFEQSDAAFIHRLMNEPAWIRYIGDRNITSLESAADYIDQKLVESYRVHGYGLYAIVTKGAGQTIGMCGLVNRPTLEDVDLGFALLEQFVGNGYALEAALAVLDHAKNEIGIKRVVAITNVDNDRSIKLLERLEMKFESLVQTTSNESDLRLYAVDL